MRRLPWRAIAAAALLFLVVLVVRLPASWLRTYLPQGITCREVSGTIWSGECQGLALSGVPAGDLDWDMQPGALLRGRLGGSFAISQPLGNARADFEAASGGRLTLRALQARFTLEPALARAVPQGLSGQVALDITLLELEGRRVRALRGRIETHELVQRSPTPVPLGAYELRFDSPPQPNGDIVGVVRDLGGPVAFDGTLRLTPQPGYLLEGRVAGRAGIDPNLESQFALLGAPEADGRRPLSVEGTL
jgi:hypothetical protein